MLHFSISAHRSWRQCASLRKFMVQLSYANNLQKKKKDTYVVCALLQENLAHWNKSESVIYRC